MVAIYMEDSCQGQIEAGLHFFDVCVAVNVTQVLESEVILLISTNRGFVWG